METVELKDKIVKLLDDKKGDDIRELFIGEKSSIADYFIIATGKNVTHVKALAEFVEEKLEEEGIFAIRKEGLREGRWAVLDYGSIMVHIFNSDTRDFFCLERLWK